jgi:hypothetical protein
MRGGHDEVVAALHAGTRVPALHEQAEFMLISGMLAGEASGVFQGSLLGTAVQTRRQRSWETYGGHWENW